MKAIKRGFKAIHPGEILKDGYLDENGISTTLFAELVGVSRNTMSNILSGRQAITPAVAVRIAELLGTSAKMWLDMQAEHDIECIRDNIGRTEYRIMSHAKRELAKGKERRSDDALRKMVSEMSQLDKSHGRAGRKTK